MHAWTAPVLAALAVMAFMAHHVGMPSVEAAAMGHWAGGFCAILMLSVPGATLSVCEPTAIGRGGCILKNLNWHHLTRAPAANPSLVWRAAGSTSSALVGLSCSCCYQSSLSIM